MLNRVAALGPHRRLPPQLQLLPPASRARSISCCRAPTPSHPNTAGPLCLGTCRPFPSPARFQALPFESARGQAAPFHSSPPRRQKINKVVRSPEAALAGLKDGHTLLVGGFGLSGVPFALLDSVRDSGRTGLTAVSNNAGVSGKGLGILVESGQLRRLVASYVGENSVLEQKFLSGEIEIELTPQGTLAERCRAGGAGIPAFYTPAGLGTVVQTGELATRYARPDGTGQAEFAQPRDVRVFESASGDGTSRPYLLERAIRGDFALVKAQRADRLGNCQFRFTARNFNPVMARAGEITVVEAEEIVEVGEIEPDSVHLPGIYVDRVVQTPAGYSKKVERIVTKESAPAAPAQSGTATLSKRERIVRRAALEFKDGMYANLGIGMPMQAAGFVDPSIEVILQSENGILGLGDYPATAADVDPDVINAGKETVTLGPGASVFGSEESFGMIRSGRVDLTILGGMQVSATGDLANWMLPGKVKGFGGAIDLASNPQSGTRVVVTMEHTDKKGRPKIVKQCDFPLTGKQCVSRIITDMCVFDVLPGEGLELVEIAAGLKVEDVEAATGAPFKVSEGLKVMLS